MFYIVNVGTGRPHGAHGWDKKVYPTERGAKGACTRLNTLHTGCMVDGKKVMLDTAQWQVVSVAAFDAIPAKMVERTNLMSGLTYMEPEDTPSFCSPASEAYWAM